MESKFKVGDRIKCLCDNSKCNSKIYTITEVSFMGAITASDGERKDFWNSEDVKCGIIVLEELYNSPLYKALK